MHRKRSAPLTTLGLSLALTLGLLALSAPAASAAGGGAVVDRNFVCSFLLPETGFAVTRESHAVVTPSGNMAAHCKAQTGLQRAKTVVLKDVPCTFLGLQGTGKVVVTKGGNVTGTCHANPSTD